MATRETAQLPNTIAVDIGGTFTDLIAYDSSSGELRQAKSLSTPRDLVRGILDCVAKSGVELATASEVVHGSTIAINTVLEHKGARTALLVTKGTRDAYAIGRGNRPAAYDIFFRRPTPLVPRSLTFEVIERLRADGQIETPLEEDCLPAICEQLRDAAVEAVAVCLLHSFTNPDHERRVGEVLRAALPDVYVSLSHEILREYREYERISTTVINAYVGPIVGRYVEGLDARLAREDFTGALWIMQSNGGVMAPAIAARKPVAMLESGPVGGIIAAAEVGRALGIENVIAFDMGGTTAKASLIRDGTPSVADGYHVGGYTEGHPVRSPVVDVVEVGTGGGSIAWIDEFGGLKVGPRSAGAEPGPIAYGRGGTQPTITDANVVLGRARPAAFMGGEMALDAGAARAGIDALAGALGIEPIAAAHGILEIAISKMALAVREVSVAKGYDPRDFVLLCSGGAGPMHGAALARELDIPRIVIPRFPGHFSAVGMLVCDQKHDLVRTLLTRLDLADPALLRSVQAELAAAARAMATAASGSELLLQTWFDLRYAGQDFTLPVPVTQRELDAGDLETVRERFDGVHERRFSHSAPQERVELVNVRLTALAAREKPRLGEPGHAAQALAVAHEAVHWSARDDATLTPVYRREQLAAGTRFGGPAIVEEYASTTIVAPGDALEVTATGELLVTIGAGRA